MKRFLSFFAALFWAISVPALPPPIQPNKATTNAVPPYVESSSGLGTNNIFRGATLTADPNGTNMVTTALVIVRTNQNFIIQDSYGNNLISLRRDQYSPGTNSEYFYRTGSPGSPVVDWEMEIANGGAVIGWYVNGNLHNGFKINTGGGVVSYMVENLTYEGNEQDNTVLFDNFAKIYPVRILSQYGSDVSSVAVGAAAGSGATVTIDGTGNDVAAGLTLTTGTSTTAGTLLTYTYSTPPGAFAVPPIIVFSGANDAGSMAHLVVYATSTTTVLTVTATAPLDASTVYKWSFHIISTSQ